MSASLNQLQPVTVAATRTNSALFPSAVPVSANVQSTGQGIITFSIGTSPSGPWLVTFGEKNTPLSVSPLEIPSRLSALGGVQNHAIHMFPGGYKTVQALGAFPHELRWRGILTGGNASPRSFEIDTLRRSGATGYIKLGPWLWKGLVTSYLADFLHQNYITYEMSFEPTADLTSTVAQVQQSASASMSSLLQQINSQYLASTSLLSLASQAALSTFANTVQAFVYQAATGQASLSSSDILSITEAQAGAQGALAVDAISSDPQVAAQALGAQGAANTLVAGLLTQQIQTSLQVVNPNLVSLAAQYLGDASRWQEIANLNGLTDIEPAGLYTLAIPTV